MNPSSTLQYFKKPFFWKLGYLKLNKKAKIVQTTVDDTEVNLETCAPLSEEGTDAQLSLTALKGELDSAVTQYLSQVKDLGYKSGTEEGSKDQKLLAVKFKLDPEEIKPKNSPADEKEQKPKIKVISRQEKGEQTQLEVELPSLDNPLYITLSECSTGLLKQLEEEEQIEDDEDINGEALTFEHFYENGQFGSEDEHIYENVENSNGEEEEHLYDTLPRPKPDVPPKPDFLSQLAARQSEPVKRAWNPFVNLSVDTGETPSFDLSSPLSSPESNQSTDNPELTDKTRESDSNPFRSSGPRGTSEQTLILDGSETSDLGSSGGEDDSRSVEDWPLPPTPPPGGEEIVEEDNPLPPPPPELALQELEEAVIREEEEERKLALKKEKQLIEKDYGINLHGYEGIEKVEAVNKTLASIEDTYSIPNKKSKSAFKEVRKEPKIIEIDDEDYEEFNTPAIRHSVIIALKDSIPTVPQSIKPSDIRRKESIKRSESLKKVGIFKPKDGKHHIERRESIFKLFPQTVRTENKQSVDPTSVSVGVYSPREEKSSIDFTDTETADQIIEISEDGSWEMKNSMEYESANQTNQANVDPFTGIPIMAPPLSPVGIPAPPSEFQSNDGVDGVFSADVVTTHSGPSSLASTIADSTVGELAVPTSPTMPSPPETILEESPQEIVIKQAKVSPKEITDVSNNNVLNSPTSPQKNIGVAIMESYENEFQKKKESMNLPEVSLLEFGDSVRDLEEQRRSVIKQMTVKNKKKDTWIKTCHMHSKGNEDAIPIAPSRAKRKNSPNRANMEPVEQPRSDIGHYNHDEPIKNDFINKDIEVDIPRISNIIETINNSVEASQIGLLQKGPVEPEAPPKVSRKKKTPQKVEAPVESDTIDGKDSSTTEVVIPQENSETEVVFSPTPTISDLNSEVVEELLPSLATDSDVVNEKNVINAMNIGHTDNMETPPVEVEEKNPTVNGDAVLPDHLGDEGEVEYFSILDNKLATKTYWESRMLATMEDGGWESVGNVRFQPVPGVTPVVVQAEDAVGTVTPPPEFIPAPPPQFDNSPADSGESSPPSLEMPLQRQTSPRPDDSNPTKKYVYGVSDKVAKDKRGAHIVEAVSKKNVIEAEIMAQQLKEQELRQEVSYKNSVLREKGASSPASHESDEGFVDRLGEDMTTVSSNGYSHGIKERDEGLIYNTVSPPPEYFASGNSTPTPSSTTETKIALEIRELKEREDELRRMRAQLSSSRENLNEDEESRSSSSREQLMEDHLTSFTTTTDEGNFSECGDPASSEDKSSDGSNSRIMSPELHHPEFYRRKVTVKPFEDEEEDQPVYTRMQKESVIEREIRLAREREEAFRKEKGLLHNNNNNVINHRPISNNSPSVRPSAFSKEDPRDVQHRMATSRIQLEIQETCDKEQELRKAGKILTTSEETVDAKVTRMSDFTDISQIDSAWNRTPPSSSASSSPSPRGQSISSPTPAFTKRSPSPRSPSSPVPSFNLAPPPSRGMTKSLSTTNLASPTATSGMRAPKGLMQKFIASRGKLTASAFASPPPTNLHTTSTSRGIPTRPMRVEPKSAVLQRESTSRQVNGEPEPSAPNPYRRSYCTAEEKIQSELKEMQAREEELKRHRARLLAQSQPNLAMIEDDFEAQDDMSDTLHEMNGLRTVLSNPNLLEDEPEQTQAIEKGVRRRSALIAQWENRIQNADT